MMAAAYYVGVFLGAFFYISIPAGIVYRARAKMGDDRLAPPFIYGTWVALALAGLFMREDYDLIIVIAYPLTGFVMWGIVFLSRMSKRPKISA